jgi:hypothetical protein
MSSHTQNLTLYLCEDEEKTKDSDSEVEQFVDQFDVKAKDIEMPNDVGAQAAETPPGPPLMADVLPADEPLANELHAAEHAPKLRTLAGLASRASQSVLAQHAGFKGDDLELLSTFKSLRSHVDLLATRDPNDLCERQFLRDELASALLEEANAPSVYVLYWAMHNLASSAKNAKFDYRWAYRYCILSMVIQIVVPFLCVAVYVHPRVVAGEPLLKIVCPMAHEELQFLDFAVHVTGYLLCVMTFLATWGKVKDEALVFEFLAKCKYVPFDMKDQENTGVLIPQSDDSWTWSPQARMLSLGADIQKLSCKRCAPRLSHHLKPSSA